MLLIIVGDICIAVCIQVLWRCTLPEGNWFTATYVYELEALFCASKEGQLLLVKGSDEVEEVGAIDNVRRLRWGSYDFSSYHVCPGDRRAWELRPGPWPKKCF